MTKRTETNIPPPHPGLAGKIRQTKIERESQANGRGHAKPTRGLAFEYAKDFSEDISPRWIVKNVIARGEITSWVGPPGSGKSANVGDLAVHIVGGLNRWRGNLIKEKCGVLYLALERHYLVKRRFKVQARKYGLSPGDLPFAVTKAVINLMDKNCVELIADTIKDVEAGWSGIKVGMLVIDTSAKAIAAGGGDESTAKDTNIAHANLRRIQDKADDVHIALIGHTGKDESKGQRGSNAPRGDIDKENIFKDHEVWCTKNNDGKEGRLFGYRMEVVNLGLDPDGDEVTIAIVADDNPDATKGNSRSGLSDSQRRAMELLDRALLDHGTPPPSSPQIPHSVTNVVLLETWRAYCLDGNLSTTRDSSERTFRRVVPKLANEQRIGTWEDVVWVAYD